VKLAHFGCTAKNYCRPRLKLQAFGPSLEMIIRRNMQSPDALSMRAFALKVHSSILYLDAGRWAFPTPSLKWAAPTARSRSLVQPPPLRQTPIWQPYVLLRVAPLWQKPLRTRLCAWRVMFVCRIVHCEHLARSFCLLECERHNS